MAAPAPRLLPALLPAALLAALLLPRAPAPAAGGEGAAEDGAAAAARLFGERCASCHSLPDPALATDRAWIDQCLSTAWSDTPPGAREALAAWLRSDAPARPAAAPAAGEGRAAVAASFPAGSAVLEGSGGAVRVVLSPGAKERPGLAPGPWRVRSTWIERELDGEAWYLSASGPAAAAVEAKAGEEFPLEVSGEVRFRGSARVHGKGLALGFELRGDRDRGVTLWRAGKRIMIRYTVLGPEGKVLASGPMTYGWGGGGWARVGPEAAGAEAVEFAVETGPFARSGETRVAVK